ncbi:MAG: menaquinone biosynthesis protein [Caldilineaceae bacterium SB0664_bin_27]|uniref:Chorismate dehydratase n=1 Tax=Caldilineaceae bacterium SB0664_bin_27 TaxID=2605260 RepID=A0A6B0YRU0_9CHLR|nr:menaquinone biosynthesis protein [Caldilineaceae bacterium SB0664_bin_27]
MLNWQRSQAAARSPHADRKPIRVGCVEYLNARPLWHGLGKRPDLFSLKYAVPSRVSSWLHNGEVDLALVSSIEYTPQYRVVPGAAVTSNGPVGSVAAFSRIPLTRARSVALDDSSRTSAALMRILCAEWFDIEPEFVTMSPDLPAMLQRCDAALLIGDRALFVDHVGMGLRKHDLCEEWRGMTRLPFVFAFWTGLPDALTSAHLQAVRDSRRNGVTALDDIACAHYPNNETLAATGRAYLHKNIQYRFDVDCFASLRRFYNSASRLGIIQQAQPVLFYDS